jgi:formyltetrahydrofolate deformylase
LSDLGTEHYNQAGLFEVRRIEVDAPTATLLITSRDRAGIIAAISNLLYSHGCNIINSDQHTEEEDGRFFWRIFLTSERLGLDQLRSLLGQSLEALLPDIGIEWELHDSAQREKMVIMVSRLPHCMMDLLNRYHFGELDADVAAVISNHLDMGSMAGAFGVPFAVIPVEKDLKAEAEATLLKRLRDLSCDTVVLARYMQVLSGDFLRAWNKPIINIHHSFLPAFAGNRPHKQAYDRGVKLIGATAHYVTEELDAGPIIAQATIEVSHRDSVRELTRKGKDVEVMVLAKAVRAHLQKRVLIHHNRTIVFD